MWRRASLSSFCALALWIGGCPKRQGPARIVFVPAPPPPAAEAPAETAQVLVIEEPTPVEEEPVTPPPATTNEPTTIPKPKPHTRADSTTHADDNPAPDATLPPAAEVPALEPLESTEEATALRQKIQRLLEEVGKRLSRLDEGRLPPDDRKTLEDARTFFAQSGRALDGGDLQRAFNLARKASLLVAALE